MKTHTTLKRRLLSAALALIMTGSLLPAGVFTPKAEAIGFTGGTLTIDNQGNWTVEFTGGDGTDPASWAVIVLPNVRGSDGSPAPSKRNWDAVPPVKNHTNLKDIGNGSPFPAYVDASQKGSADTVCPLRDSKKAMVDDDGNPTTTFTWKGSLGKTVQQAFNATTGELREYWDAEGNHVTGADRAPFIAYLYSSCDPPRITQSAEFTWTRQAEGELEKGEITSSAYPGGGLATSTESISCINEPVTYVSYSVALVDKDGNVFTGEGGPNDSGGYTSDNSLTISGASLGGTISLGDKTFNLNLNNLKPKTAGASLASGSIPITGTITINYRPGANADSSVSIKTHTIPVSIGSPVMVISGGTYRTKVGTSNWIPVGGSTTEVTMVPANSNTSKKLGCFPYSSAAVSDSDQFVSVQGPAYDNNTNVTIGKRPSAATVNGSAFSVGNVFTVKKGGKTLTNDDKGNHVVSITYPCAYSQSSTKAIVKQDITFLITVIVEEGEAEETYTVTFEQPDGAAGVAYPSVITTPDPLTDKALADKFDLPNYTDPAHWTFKGWKYGDVTIDPDTTPKASIEDFGGTGDITLEAVWEYQPQYTITYDLNAPAGVTGWPSAADKAPDQQSGDFTDTAKETLAGTDSFSAPTGYQFAGWSTNSAAKLGDTDIYPASSSQTVKDMNGTKNDDTGDYAVTLYAIWVTPAKIEKVYAYDISGSSTPAYEAGNTVSLYAVDLSDTPKANEGQGLKPTEDRWKNNVVIEAWAMGTSMGYINNTITETSANSYKIPDGAQAGDWVWVKVTGKGSSTPPNANDIAQAPEAERWFRVVKVGAAEAKLTAKVVYYNPTGTTTAAKYPETKPNGVTEAAKINGSAGTFKGDYVYPQNITLTTTSTDNKLEFIGWTTKLPHEPLNSDCSHSTQHHIIQAGSTKTDTSIIIQMDNNSPSGDGTNGKAVATTVYAVYKLKDSAALKVEKALKGTNATTKWTGDDAAHATVATNPTKTTSMLGGETANVTASIDTSTYNYKFIGWMKAGSDGAPDGTLITASTTADDAKPLSGVNVGATGGMGAATFTMPSIPVATTIYAVYEAIPTKTLIVKHDAGIQSVTVKYTRDGKTNTVELKNPTTADGITTYSDITVRATDVVTIASTAKSTDRTNGFTVSGECINNQSNSNITLLLNDDDTVTVTAKSKKAPPALTLTATNGQGTQVVSGNDKTTNTTTNASVAVANANTSEAVVQSVTLSGGDYARFTLSDSDLGAASSKDPITIAAGGSNSIAISPDNTNYKNWEVGDYHFNVTVTYTNPNYKDADGNDVINTVTVPVTYTVVEDTSYTAKVTVKIDGQPAYQVGGTSGPTATVKLGSDASHLETNGHNVDQNGVYVPQVTVDGKTTAQVFTAPQTIQVSYGGKDYIVPEQLSKTNNDVTVNLYTVTIQLKDGRSIETGALATSDGKTPQFTLTVTDKKISGNTASATQTAASKSSASVVVLKGSSVEIKGTDAEGTTDATKLNTTYSFDKWAEGSYDVDGSGATAAVTLPDIGTTPYTFTVEGKTTYTAYLKRENWKVLTFNDNRANAPHIMANPNPATNMPSSQQTMGTSVKIPSGDPILPGYEFVGWSTNATTSATGWSKNGTTNFAPGDTVTMDGDKTLYAVWKDATLTIKTVPTIAPGTYGKHYTFDLATSMTVAPTGTALHYETDLAASTGLTMDATTGALTGYPRTTAKDKKNEDNTVVAADGFPNAAFTPTFTVTLAQDYHKTGFEVKAILVADGSGAEASRNKVSVTEGTETKQVDGNAWTYHTATGKKLEVAKADTRITGIAISNVNAGTNLTTASYTVSVTGPLWQGETNGWDFAHTVTMTFATTNNGFERTSATPGDVAFVNTNTSNSDNFEASGSTTVKASFTPTAEDATGKASSDNTYTSFDAYDATNHKNLQSHVWNGINGTQTVTPGASTGKLEVSADGEHFAPAASHIYQTNELDGSHLNARKEYVLPDTLGTNGLVTRNTNGKDAVAGKQFTLKNTGDIDTGTLAYSFGLGTENSPFELATADDDATASIAKNGTNPIVVKVKTGLAPGTYTDTLTFKNDTTKVSASIVLTFTVDRPATFDAYITVLPQTTSAAKPTTAQALPDGLSIKTNVASIGNAERVTGDTGTAHLGEYKLTGLAVGTNYQLVVDGTGGGNYTVPGVTINYDNQAATVTLYQVAYKTHKVPHTDTDVSVDGTNTVVWTPTTDAGTGKGWYVEGQYATMTAQDGYTNTLASNSSVTSYTFANANGWTKAETEANATKEPDEATGTVVSTVKSFTTKIEKPTTFYAHYNVVSATKVYLKYKPNGSGVADLPDDEEYSLTGNATNHEFTIPSDTDKPTRKGYTFVGWSTNKDQTVLGWNVSNDTDFARGGKITVSTSNTDNTQTLYAIWAKAGFSGDGNWTETLPEGTYGEPYSKQITIPGATDGAAVTVTAQWYDPNKDNGTGKDKGGWVAGLPGGLKLDPDSGIITGKPYMVSEGTALETNGFQVKFTATHSVWNSGDTAVKDSVEAFLKVNKHNVTLTGTSVTNVVAGQSVTTGKYETTVVELPLYDGKENDGVTDKWTTFTETVHFANADSDKGTLSINTDASTTFSATDDVSVELKYTPTSDATKGKDANESVHSAIYKYTTTTIKAPGGGADYTMKIKLGNETEDSDYAQSKEWTYQTNETTPKNAKVDYSVDADHDTGYVTATETDGVITYSVAAKKFVLKNTGNQDTGKLSYAFGSGDNTAFEIVGFDDADAKAALEASLATTDTPRNVVVKVKAGLAPGTYKDTLVITNANGNSVSAVVTFTVEKADVPVTISTYLWDVGATVPKLYATGYPNTNAETKTDDNTADEKTAITAAKKVIPNSGTVVLVNVNDATETVSATWNATATAYKANIDYDTTYHVVINGYTVPGVTISRTKNAGHIYLYQVTTAYAPVDNTTTDDVNEAGATQAPKVENSTGDASAEVENAATNSIYVVKDEVATVTENSKAATGFNYKEIQDADGDAVTNTHTYTVVVKAPAQFTAVYTRGYKLTYKPNEADWISAKPSGSTAGATDVVEDVSNGTVSVKSPSVLTKTVTVDETTTIYTGFTMGDKYTFKGWATSAISPAQWDEVYEEDGHTKEIDGTSVTVYLAGTDTTVTADMTLYAIWEPVKEGLGFAGKTITVAHYDELVDTPVSATGSGVTFTYARTDEDSVTLPGGKKDGTNDPIIIFDAANHKFTSNGEKVKYDTATTGANNEATTEIAATTDTGVELTADFKVVVVKAKTAITEPWTGVNTNPANGGVKAGDPFDFTKLTVKDGTLTVSAYKTDRTTVNSGVDFDEAPDEDGATDTTNTNTLDGQWTVTDKDGNTIDTFLAGTNDYVVTFTPTDTGFEPCSTTITLTLKKEIKEVTVTLTFPVDGKKPVMTAEIENIPDDTDNSKPGKNKTVVATTASPKAIYTDAAVKGEVIWTFTEKMDTDGTTKLFDRRGPVTAVVVIKPAEGWSFVTDGSFVGKYSDKGTDAVGTDDLAPDKVTVLSMGENGEIATLLYTWPGEDTAASEIKIKVNAPTDGGTPSKEATPMGTPLGSFVTTDIKNADETKRNDYTTKWYKAKLEDVDKDSYTNLGAEATKFSSADGGKYVVIITATVEDGYYFESKDSDKALKLAELNGSNAYATINGENAKILAVTTVTDNGKRATQVVLAREFTVNASEVVGLRAEDSKLDYYVMTDSNATTDMTHKIPAVTKAEDKHYDASATGHNSAYGFTLTAGSDSDTVKIYAIDKNGDRTVTSNVVLFVDVDGTGKTTGKYDAGDTLLSVKTVTDEGQATETTTYSTPGYTFIPTPKDGANQLSNLDGKTLYAAYVDGNGTKTPTISAEDAKVVAVGTLHVKPLKATSIALVNSWSVDADKKFQIDDTKTTTVTFNTGDAMANTVANVSYAARAKSLATSVTAPVAAADTTKTRPNYYYMLDANSDGQITNDDVELTDEKDVSSYGGKSVYICYTDVNGHLVTAYAGVIGANFTVDVDDENGQQPEYGDKLTGEPQKPNGDPATPSDENKPFTYEWEKWIPGGSEGHPDTPDNPDADNPGRWAPIPGATSPEYVPGKDDVGDDIRVSVTDPGTGTTVPSAPKHIEKRSINFDVAAVDKRYDGDCYNDDHAYTTADFTAKRVEKVWNDTDKRFDPAQKDSVDTLFGGLLLGDAVTIAPYNDPATSGDNDVDWNDVKTIPAGMADKHYTGRPTYQTYDTDIDKYVDNPAVGSQIRWPWVLEKDTVTDAAAGTKIVSHAVDATDGYDLDGADKNYYRLVPQDAMIPRGEITDGTVTHVDVSFKEWPTYDHLIPGTPMGVTDERETMAGEKSHTDDKDTRQIYTAEWYEVVDGKTFDPEDSDTYTAVTTTEFNSNVRYAVKVTVKPQTGYNYELDETKSPYTRFYFHFGEYADEKKVEVTDNQHDATTKIGQGVWKHDASGEAVYTMYYTFDTVALPDIAYVNVSIPQPVAEVEPATTVKVIQLIGTDNEPIATSKVTVGDNEPVWEYLADPDDDTSWTKIVYDDPSTTNADESAGVSKDGTFLAETKYRVKFTLTADKDKTNGYKYRYTDDTTPVGVRFVASGEGEIKNANIYDADGHTWSGDSVINKEIIESVVTNSASAEGGKKAYEVTITYKPVKSGKADLIDVVVDASAATKAGVEMTGPAVGDDKKTIYDLDSTVTTSNKWFYWDGTAWAPASANVGLDKDGNFQAGYDYKVEGTVKLIDTAHYQITNKTKFYIAGYECKTTDAVTNPDKSDGGKTLTINTSGAYTTYTLVKTFSIPAENIDVVSVTHNLPLTSGKEVPKNPDDWSDENIVTIGTDSDVWVKLGTADALKDNFDTTNTPGTPVTEGTDTFEEDNYYRVTSIISPKANSGYQFKTGSTEDDKAGNTVVVINGVAVNVDGAAKPVKSKDDNGNEEIVAYVKAVYNSTTKNVEAMLVAKVKSSAINPIELRHDTIVPTTGADIPSAPFQLLNPTTETRYVVDTSKHNGGAGTWEYLDTTAKDDDHPDGTWTAVNTTTKVGLDEEGKFLDGTKYRVTVGVKATGTNVFAANGVTKGTVTVDSLVYNASVTVTEDNHTPPNADVHRKTADVTITFNPTGTKTATLVTAYFKYKPVAEKVPATETYETGKYSYKFPMNVENHPTETIGTLTVADDVDSMQTFDVTWYDTTDLTADFHPSTNHGTALTGTDAFAVNKKYTVAVKVKPAAGWQYILNATEDPANPNTKFKIYAGDEGFDANVWQDEDNDCYIMWYTFNTLNLPKIAYVNVSIPQPVAEVEPTDKVNVIQLIGTDNEVIDNTNDSVVSGGKPTWQYKNADGDWVTAEAEDAANNKHGLSAAGEFLAEKEYRAIFTLTVDDDSGYEYLYADGGTGVRFVASGEGELANANIDGDHTLGTIINDEIIASVVTADTDTDATNTSGKKAYKVTITYKPVKSGKADLMDVVVDASAATKAGVEMTGPTVANKPYELVTKDNGSGTQVVDTTKSKWSYWNGSAWTAVVVDTATPANNKGVDKDGKFLAGYDYRVEAKVKLKDTDHYRITDNTTKFYIAGDEVKTDVEVEYHNTTNETALTADKPAVDHIYPDGTVFTLVKTFSIPAENIGVISVTHDLPLVAGANVPTSLPSTAWSDSNIVTITDATGAWVKLGTADTLKDNFDAAGSAAGATFEVNNYYRVTSTITPVGGYQFKIDNTDATKSTVVVINGVPVNVGGDAKAVKDGKGETVAYVKAVYDSTKKVVKAMLVAKVAPAVVNRITITYPEPIANTTPVPNRKNLWTWAELSNQTQVAVAENVTTDPETDGTTWYVAGDSAPTAASSFDTSGKTKLSELPTKKFGYGTYYMVEGVITPASTNYAFDEAGNIIVTINGIEVKVDDAETKDGTTTKTFKTKYQQNSDGTQTAIGWAIAESVKDANGNVTAVKARYIAKTEAAPSHTIYKVIASVTAPSVNGSISDQAELEEARFDNEALATTNVSKSTVNWYVSDEADGTYAPVTVTTGSEFERGKYYKAEFTVWANNYADTVNGYHFESKNPGTLDGNGQMTGDFVAFRINGVKKTGTDIWGINDDKTWDEVTDADTGIKVKTERVVEDVDSKPETPDTANPDKYKITVWFPLNGELEDDFTVIGQTGTPARGQTASATTIKVKDGEPYEIKNAADAYWEHWTNGAWKKITDTTETFKAGDYYRAVLTAGIKDDHKNLNKFTTKTRGEVNEEAARTATGSLPADKPDHLNGLRTSILHNDADNDDNVESVTLAQEFYVNREVVEAHIYAREPKAGDWAYSIGQDVVIHASHTDSHYADTRYTLSDQSHTAPAAQWYYKDDSGDYVLMGHDVPFQEGGTYFLITDAKALEGYCFADSLSSYKWFDSPAATAAAREDASQYIQGPNKEEGEVTSSRVAFKIQLAPPNTVNVVPGNVVPPQYNQPLDRDGWGDSNFTVVEGGVKWYEGTVDKNSVGGSTPVTDANAKESTIYTAVVTVKPNDGVQVAPDGSLTYKFNGADITANVNEYIKNEDGTFTLFHTFPPTGKREVEYTGGGGGGSTTVESPVVYYHLKDQGVTDDPTAEKVRKNSTPKQVPKVKAMTGLKFLGWSEVDPGTLPAGKLPTLVDPTTFKITKDKWFYAVYEQGTEVDHLHYVIGFPNGTFAPDAKITRAEVATIIARSCLEGFVEGANYGNPGNYNDVTTHWAFSAIAFCAREGVFNGYEDGTFRPDRYITRQELATVVARLAGIQTSQGVPFNDRNQIASWAMNGVYTAYANGWIKGYEDSTFQPEREISRAETVKIFNGYLKRGVDAKGLEGLKEYIHTGVASNNTENGHDEYMTWPDVPKTHWAYHEIIEAANDHNYHWQDEAKKTPPEDWDEVYIDEKWRYNDNASDGAEKRDENMTLQKTFTVTYLVSSNGVTYDAITETVDRFASPKPENMPVAVPNEGYRFAGWSSTDPSTGTITLVDPTASSVTSDEWFYAVFEEDKSYTLPVYTVTYVIGDLGSYDGATVEQVEMYQAPSVSGLPQPTASEGYRFAGWSETDPATGSYTIVDPTANYVTGDKTFYAVYEEEGEPYHLPVYTVTYVIGENGSYDGATVEQVEMFQAPSVSGLPQPVANEGYRFLGWSETDPATGSYSIMDPTANYVTDNKTFYAVYEAV